MKPALSAALAALMLVSPAAFPQAESFPSQPLRIVVGFSAGSTTDILARAVASKLTDAWGKPVVVENRPGAGGVVASQALLSAPGDGHTLMSVSAGHAVSAALYKSLPYDTERDFAGVTLLATVPSILVVPADSSATSVKELLAAIRAKPGAYNYSSPGVGSANHLAGALFSSLGELQVQHVAYKGIPQALQAAMTGEALYNFSPIVNVLPAAKGGRVRALATSTSKRSVAMPELPTVAEQGLPKFEAVSWYALMAPAGTPAAVVDRLNAESARALAKPAIKEKFAAQGLEPGSGKPQDLAATIRTETARWSEVIRKQNIKPD